MRGIFSLGFLVIFLNATNLIAHDGPHLDIPAPKYTVEDQAHRAGVWMNASGSSIMLQIAIPQSSIVNQERGPLKPNLDKQLQEALQGLKTLEFWLKLSSSGNCQQSFQSDSFYDKHRALKAGLEEMEVTEREEFIQTYKGLAATFRISCDAPIKLSDMQLQTHFFKRAPYLQKLFIHIRQAEKKILYVLEKDELLKL
ncbi:MAG: ZrgA family zinc uptake protein [Oligoflexus sp.]